MDQPAFSVNSDTDPLTPHKHTYSIRRIRIGLVTAAIGFTVFILGARPSLIGQDRSPVIGIVQIITTLAGLAIICISGYVCIMAFWRHHRTSIPADIGIRLVGTGYVIAFFSGTADIFGLGSHPLPSIPYFGELQAFGVEIGLVIIAFGFLLMIPYFRFFKSE